MADLEIIDGKIVDHDEEKFFKEYTINANGHQIWYRRFLDGIIFHNEIWDKTNARLALDPKVQQDLTRAECSTCGLRVQTKLEDKVFTVIDPPCSYPNDHVPLTFDLEVPSGIMVVRNDMRSLLTPHSPPDVDFQDDLSKNFYVNTKLGCVNSSLWYAARKMAHCFVGNTMPSMARVSEEHLQIGRWFTNPADDDWGEEEPPGEVVATICTDLWWFSIMDKITFEEAGGDIEEPWTDMVAVQRGTWTFEHHWHENGFEQDAGISVYTDIRYKG